MFICFEGIAGSGKTTQANLLADYLKSTKKINVFLSSVFEGLRREAASVFMNATGIKSDQNAMMFLFQALHAAQYYEVEKEMSSGKVVIADRWRYSFFAHHIYKNTFKGDEDLMSRIDLLAYRSLEPDIYLLIDTPVEDAYSRYIKREKTINRTNLELVDIEYFTSVNNYYKNLAQNNKWCVIDGSDNQLVISERIQKVINKKL